MNFVEHRAVCQQIHPRCPQRQLVSKHSTQIDVVHVFPLSLLLDLFNYMDANLIFFFTGQHPRAQSIARIQTHALSMASSFYF